MKSITKNSVIFFLFSTTHFATSQFNKSSTLSTLVTRPEVTKIIVAKWYRQSNIKKVFPLELVDLIRKKAIADEIELINLLNSKITNINNHLNKNIPNNILYSKKRIRKILYHNNNCNIKHLVSCFNSLSLINHNINVYICTENIISSIVPYELNISIDDINNKILSMKHQCINENTQKKGIFISFENVQKYKSCCLIL